MSDLNICDYNYQSQEGGDTVAREGNTNISIIILK
jgi:hypothetical protein